MGQKITKDMTFQQVLQMSPEVSKVLGQFNLGCVGCMGAIHESIEQGAKVHGLDVDEVIAALNAIFSD